MGRHPITKGMDHASCWRRWPSGAKRRQAIVPGVKAQPRSNGHCPRRRHFISSRLCHESSAQILVYQVWKGSRTRFHTWTRLDADGLISDLLPPEKSDR